MLHPLFSTLVHRPDLVVDHASAYAALLQAEAGTAAGALATRALAWVLVAIGALLCLVFTGVALMLGLLMDQFHWVLVAVPGACLLLTLLALTRTRTPQAARHFERLKAQFDDDVRALRSVA